MTDKRRTIVRAIRADHPYFMLSRTVAQNIGLSYEALGLLAFLLSKPDGWQVQPEHLARKGSGRDRVYRLLAELRQFGHIERITRRDDHQRVVSVEYIVIEHPNPQHAHSEPLPEKPDPALPDPAKPHSKREYREKQNTEKIPASQPTREKASSPKSAKPRPRNPAYDATAEAFPHIKLPALIQKHVSLLTGRDTGRKEEWNEFRLDPGLRPYEIWQFGQWMNERANRMDITAPRQPDKIAQWAEDWRAEVEEDIYQTALINSQTEFVDETGKGHVFSRDTWIDELKERRLREEKEWEQERMKS